LGQKVKGAASWYNLTLFSLSPADPAKLALILILSKYFSRRHVEIARFKHIIISGIYALIFFALVFFQPDFGSAVVIFLIWFGMVMASGINKKHLLYLGVVAAIVLTSAWMFVLKPYQKDRVINFLHPLQDIRGSGYNAYQSKVAIGSGGMWGKGIGFGTQSRLEFLPEHQTDFIFAAFAEEWGLAGVFFIFTFYTIVVWRILKNAFLGQSNFESLFGIGLAVFLIAQFIIHVGMNIGLLPVTGLGLPLMSYGGSSLITTFAALGILMGMRRYSRTSNREEAIINF
jgi:rod shape determining protein RodA